MFNAPPESPWKSKSCAVTCESTYALIDCWVASDVALSEAILSSSAIAVIPESKFNSVAVESIAANLVKSAWTRPVTPSSKFNSAAVEVTAANFVKSACTNPETPSSKFNSVAVAVNATSSFILGDVNVLFVNVCVPANVATVASIANETWLLDTVESIPVPPASVKVSPVLNVSSEPLSAAIVNWLDAGAANDRLPEPSVVNIWPLEPSVPGKVNVKLLATLLGDFNATKCAPLLVPSLNFIVPPTVAERPINNSSIALFESTIIADEAVSVPCAWSNKSFWYWPPISIAAFDVDVWSPMNNRRPLPPAPVLAADVS